MNAADADAVTHAANEAERRLKYHRLDIGESRSGTVRVLFEPPLVVYYKVDDATKNVAIRSVREM
jgi:hypothetical protein